ncbi:MAG: LytR C-terminal domain-containing protein [Actinomycetes bacterium]
MNHPDDRVRRGAHRTRRDLTRALVPSLLAVLAVAALVTSLYVWRAEDGDPPAASAGTATATRTTGAPDETTSEPPSPTAPPASTPENTSPPERSASDLEVVVLNQTSRRGLAGDVADRLRAAGFDVVATGNFTGAVPSTTVYYPAGAKADARAAAEALPTDPRTRPRFGNLSTTRLTVVVTLSYPG